MKLSIVIPAFNERETIRTVIERVRKVSLEGLTKEIVVVDDGSTDGTREILDELSREHALRDTRAAQTEAIELVVILHERNQGKGAALRTGFARASGDIVMVQDADLEYDPRDYPKLLAPILDGRADVVFGSRFVSGEARRVLYFWHYVANRGLTLLSNMLTNVNLSDMETCYKVFRGDVIRRIRIQENRFGFEPEITAKVAALGCRIFEVGISYTGRTYAEGKKIGWRDGVRALWCIVKYGGRRGVG